jgi:uncharacterized protein
LIYFDTSVLAAYYTLESQTPEAKAIVDQAGTPAISEIGIAEFNVVIARKAKQGLLSPEAVTAVYDMFDEHLHQIFHRVPLGTEHLAAVRQLAARSGVPLRTLDALHLAFAMGLGAPIATFDRRLADAARDLGADVLP